MKNKETLKEHVSKAQNVLEVFPYKQKSSDVVFRDKAAQKTSNKNSLNQKYS